MTKLNKSNFSERLKDLLFDKQINAEQLAAAIGVHKTTSFRWLADTYQPPLSNALAIADYFGCSLEYLSGKTDIDYTILPKENYVDFYIRLKEVMNEKNISTYAIIKNNSRYSNRSFNCWRKGADPSLSTLIELSNILDVTIDYLVGRDIK